MMKPVDHCEFFTWIRLSLVLPEAQAEPVMPVAVARRDGRGIAIGIIVFKSSDD